MARVQWRHPHVESQRSIRSQSRENQVFSLVKSLGARSSVVEHISQNIKFAFGVSVGKHILVDDVRGVKPDAEAFASEHRFEDEVGKVRPNDSFEDVVPDRIACFGLLIRLSWLWFFLLCLFILCHYNY